MRMTTLAAAGAAFILAGAANAQAPATPRGPAAPPASQAPSTAAPEIKSVNVIELRELPETTQAQVNQLVAQRSADQNQQLQNAIEGMPAAKAAVEAKGFSSRDVLIAQVNAEGTLLVITKRAS